MRDLQTMSVPELVRYRQKIERDPQYRAPLVGINLKGQRILRKIQDEIERRVRNE